MDPDLLLLRKYARQTDPTAFEAVVRRHVDLVFSAAMRQLHDQHQAEDVTQAVFILLAKRANRLADGLLVGGWLVNATRLISKSFLRSERRRSKYEQEAVAMRERSQSSQSQHNRISTLMDEVLSRLDQTSRGLLTMQYLEGQSGKEIAAALGISEDAARKRSSRALLKLRRIFAARGLAVSSNALGTAMVEMKMTAPPGLAAASAAATGGTPTAIALAKGAVVAISWGNANAMVAYIATMILVMGTAIGVTAVEMHKTAGAIDSPARAQPIVLAQMDAHSELIQGIVKGADGSPASGAEILVGSAEGQANVYGKARKEIAGVTDAEGKFSMTRPAGSFALVFRSPAGFAEVTGQQLDGETTIKLAPWGRVEGTIKAVGHPAPRVQVTLWRILSYEDPLRNLVNHQTDVKADATGHYVFPQVAPGEAWLQQRVMDTVGRTSDWEYVQVGAAKTLQVSLGDVASGRAAVGHVQVPAALTPIVAWTDRGIFTYEAMVRMKPAGKQPEHAKNETPAQYKAVEEAYGRTNAGRLAKEWIFGKHVTVDPEGTFRMEGLPAGDFTLNIRNFENLKDVNFMEDVAGAEKDFQIGQTSSTTQPTSLGEIVLTARHLVRPGAVAPDFTVTLRDDSEWKLADHKGKPVVLVLWGAYNSWEQEMKDFGDFARDWGNDPRLAILGGFTAPDDATATLHIAKYGLNFPQTNEGVKLMNLYENSWPSAVLIGSDGKIIQKHLTPQLLDELLKKTLDKH
jgi:RNA polymerase sigma factor (sigma-70 family)